MKYKYLKFPVLFCILLVIFQATDQIILFILDTHINTRAALGLNLPNHLAALISLIVLALIVFFTIISKKKALFLPLAVAASGAISNLLDRFVFGGVVDYIRLPVIPLFNLSDFAIALALIYALYILIFQHSKLNNQ